MANYISPSLGEFIKTRLGLSPSLGLEFFNRLDNLCELSPDPVSPALQSWVRSNFGESFYRVMQDFGLYDAPRLDEDALKRIGRMIPRQYRLEFIHLFDRVCEVPPETTQLTLEYDTGFPAGVSDPNSVDDWNTYLKFVDSSNVSGSFNSVLIDGPFAYLYDWSLTDIKITSTSGLSGDTLISGIDDQISGLLHSVGNNGLAGCSRLNTLSSTSLTALLSGSLGFTNITLLYAPLCTLLGPNAADNNVFLSSSSSEINIEVAANLATNNGGNPDGDIDYVITNYPASIIICGGVQIYP